MTRMVNCVKLGKEAEGLKFPPYPGELGKKIYNNISNEAWQMWVKQQTMIINEYRLSPADPKAREMIEEEMQKFLFSGESITPEQFVPPA
ncbi:oxidative damage protection protein [Candidatus Halobeggiatoa sp. HSG11]|nr:oxidative damage protection protein [Candidatus Halobeggiatoa sp. HSG11]